MGCSFGATRSSSPQEATAPSTERPPPAQSEESESIQVTMSNLDRELPLIPESGLSYDNHPEKDDGASVGSSRVGSVTTIATPTSLPISHQESVGASSIRAEADKCPDSRLDSMNYLMELDRLAARASASPAPPTRSL